MPNFAFMFTGNQEALILECVDGSIVVGWEGGEVEVFETAADIPGDYPEVIQDNKVIDKVSSMAIDLMFNNWCPSTTAVALYDKDESEPFMLSVDEELVEAAPQFSPKTLLSWVLDGSIEESNEPIKLEFTVNRFNDDKWPMECWVRRTITSSVLFREDGEVSKCHQQQKSSPRKDQTDGIDTNELPYEVKHSLERIAGGEHPFACYNRLDSDKTLAEFIFEHFKSLDDPIGVLPNA
jgi:hypothetical protein